MKALSHLNNPVITPLLFNINWTFKSNNDEQFSGHFYFELEKDTGRLTIIVMALFLPPSKQY